MLMYTRKFALMVIDFLLVSSAVFIALVLRFDGLVPVEYINKFIHSIILVSSLKLIIFYFFGLYSSLWRNASVEEVTGVFIATGVGGVASFLLGLVLRMQFPRSVYFNSWIIAFLMITAVRMSYRIARRLKKSNNLTEAGGQCRVMIIGAGDAGSMVIKELRNNRCGKYIPVAVIDDDRWKHRMKINGVRVRGGRDRIKAVAQQEKIDEIIIAMPSADKKDKIGRASCRERV